MRRTGVTDPTLHPHRQVNRPMTALVAGGLLLAAGCSSTGSEEGSPATSGSASASAPASSEAPAATQAPTPPAQTGGNTAPAPGTLFGLQPNQVPFPGVIKEPNPGDNAPMCSPYGPNNQPPLILKMLDGQLVPVVPVDARDSRPKDCNQNTDSGAGTYTGPSLQSPEQVVYGRKSLADGTMVAITGFSVGQMACNALGASPLWLRVTEGPQQAESWIPETNTDDWLTEAQLVRAGVASIPYQQYAHTAEGDC